MKKPFVSERSLLIICIVLGAVQAWICRYSRIPDGIAYLDIGDAYFRGDWHAALNAYWSPVYSWLLGLALYVLKPSMWWEFITVHFVNLIIYVFALFCFRFLMHAILHALKRRTTDSDGFVPLPDWALLAMGYGVFLWCSLVLIDVSEVTPDLMVAGIVFLIAGYLVDLRVDDSYGKLAMFGALNGAAYLSKTIMFPMGLCFLAILLVSGKITKRRIGGVLLSGVVFLIVCTPFIYALSKSKGRLTYGDTGRLAYAAVVSPGTPQRNWQGVEPGSGTPLHPTRKLLDDPPVFEFGEPISGTYPAWDDPSYWNEGLRWTFHLRSQLRVLVQSGLAYEKVFFGQLGLLAGIFIFLFLGGAPTRKAVASNWPLLAMALLGLAAYALVLVLTRYIGASVALLCVGIFAGIRLPKDERLELLSRYVAAAVAITILFSVVGHMGDAVYANMTVGSDPPARDEVKAAIALEGMGLRAGDKMAVIGRGISNQWARLARFKIVAEAAPGQMAIQEFWASDPERRDAAYECLRHTGARAVVATDPPASKLDARWKRISDTRYYIYFFPR